MNEVITVTATMVMALWGVPHTEYHIDGLATYYDPGKIERTALVRGISLEGYAGGVALNRKGDMRRIVWLEWTDDDVQGFHIGEPRIDGPYISVDCAQVKHLPKREMQGYVVEVSAELAHARGFYGVGPMKVRVWFIEPKRLTFEKYQME